MNQEHIAAMRRQCTKLWQAAAKDPKVSTPMLDLIQHLIHRVEDIEEDLGGYVRPLNLGGSTPSNKVDTQGR